MEYDMHKRMLQMKEDLDKMENLQNKYNEQIKRKDKHIQELMDVLHSEQKAAAHWMAEATLAHNNDVRLQERVEELEESLEEWRLDFQALEAENTRLREAINKVVENLRIQERQRDPVTGEYLTLSERQQLIRHTYDALCAALEGE